jgi:iron(III) transport system substrate-binding protein
MLIRKLGYPLVAGCMAVVLAGCGGSSDDSSSSSKLGATTSEACELGAQEGSVDFWNSGEEDVLQKGIDPFRKEYPKIKVNLGNHQVIESAQRLAAEAQAKQDPTADLVDGSFPELEPIFDAKLGQDVDWESYGIPKDLIAKGKDGTQLVRTVRLPGGVAYNTDQVDEADVPDTWDGLLDSKLAKKMIYDPRGLYLQSLAVTWGYDDAAAWLDKFLKLDPIPIASGSQSLLAVASGEHPISTSASGQDVIRIHAEGGPIAIKYMDIVPTVDHYSTLIAGAKHPNAAICFAAWYATPEALKVRIDLDNSFNATKPEGVPAGSKLVHIDTAEQAGQANKFAKYITEASK